jgi:hypothetical protein
MLFCCERKTLYHGCEAGLMLFCCAESLVVINLLCAICDHFFKFNLQNSKLVCLCGFGPCTWLIDFICIDYFDEKLMHVFRRCQDAVLNFVRRCGLGIGRVCRWNLSASFEHFVTFHWLWINWHKGHASHPIVSDVMVIILQIAARHALLLLLSDVCVLLRMKTVGNGRKRTYDIEKRKRSVRNISTFSN